MSSPELGCQLDKVVDSHTAGCPVQGQRWTYLSIQEIRSCLAKMNIEVSHKVIKRLLRKAGLGLRQLNKDRIMKEQIDGRNEQFLIIKGYKEDYLSKGYTVLSVDVKKKEWLGAFFRPGKTWSDQSIKCYDHDFSSFATGKVTPHGIFDLARKQGYLTLGQGPDTAQFNVACLRSYWKKDGSKAHQSGTPILLLMDGGGSNSSRNRLFKQELQDWADEAQIDIRVAHYPPYCSKYNPIEHRLFPFITQAWKGIMLDSIQTMITLVKKRTDDLACGMRIVVSEIKQTFEKGITVFDDYLEHCNIKFDTLYPKWNYTVLAMP